MKMNINIRKYFVKRTAAGKYKFEFPVKSQKNPDGTIGMYLHLNYHFDKHFDLLPGALEKICSGCANFEIVLGE